MRSRSTGTDRSVEVRRRRVRSAAACPKGFSGVRGGSARRPSGQLLAQEGGAGEIDYTEGNQRFHGGPRRMRGRNQRLEARAHSCRGGGGEPDPLTAGTDTVRADSVEE